MRTPDVVVVGAGAIGAASAYELARAGARVSVVERSHVGLGCSYGNAGLISPSHAEALANIAAIRNGIAWMGRGDSPFHVRPRLAMIPWLARFGVASLPRRSAAASATLQAMTNASLELHEQLAARGLPTSFARRGILSVFESHPAFAAARRRSEATNDPEARILTPEGARELLSALTPRIAGALYYPREAHCDPGAFVTAMLEASRELGAEIRTGIEILSLTRRNDRICELQTTGGPIHGGAVVLAAGAWTRELAGDVGIHIPVEAAKGYHVEVHAPSSSASVPAFLEDAHVTATPLNGRLRLTGTLDLSGLDLRVEPLRLEALDRAAHRTLTVPPETRRVHVWRGLRPCAPDGLPIIGRADDVENMVLATGHAMLGIALAPITGKIVADLVRGTRPRYTIEPFAPTRFRSLRRVMDNQRHKHTGRS